MRVSRILSLVAGSLLAALAVALPELAAQAADPQRAAAELLAADRAFAAASAQTDLVSGISAIFADDVIMPAPGTGMGFAEGKEAAAAQLRRDPLNATSRATWTAIRAGVSADGTHGYTLGFLDVVRADGSRAPGKYLAYWVKTPAGWRAAVYRRVPRPAGPVDSSFAGFLLPTAPSGARDALLNTADRASLAQAESEFSALATAIGLGPAFERTGDPQAMHIGGGPNVPDVVRGNVAISRNVGEGLPEGSSPVIWAADHRTIVAPSGDLGVSIGFIRSKAPGPDSAERPPFPFFTIWRRAGVNAPWKYIAE